MRLYHPAYERKRDRVTGVDFVPAELDRAKVATAEVDDPQHVRSLLSRGFLPWPGLTLPEGAPAAPSGPQGAQAPAHELPTAEEIDGLTVAGLRELGSRLSIALPAKATKAELRALIRTPF